FFDELAKMRRVKVVQREARDFWIAAERASLLESEDGSLASVRGWMESTGPTTATNLAAKLALSRNLVESAMTKLEAGVRVLRGRFTTDSKAADSEIEWCNRRLLARIHRLTLGRLRKEIEPVSSADFMRFLFTWQHVAPGTQLHGVDGTLQVL